MGGENLNAYQLVKINEIATGGDKKVLPDIRHFREKNGCDKLTKFGYKLPLS